MKKVLFSIMSVAVIGMCLESCSPRTCRGKGGWFGNSVKGGKVRRALVKPNPIQHKNHHNLYLRSELEYQHVEK